MLDISDIHTIWKAPKRWYVRVIHSRKCYRLPFLAKIGCPCGRGNICKPVRSWYPPNWARINKLVQLRHMIKLTAVKQQSLWNLQHKILTEVPWETYPNIQTRRYERCLCRRNASWTLTCFQCLAWYIAVMPNGQRYHETPDCMVCTYRSEWCCTVTESRIRGSTQYAHSHVDHPSTFLNDG